MAAQPEKVFPCLSCGQSIKLARKDDNTGWIRYNLDGSIHKDERKIKSHQTVDNSQQIAELAKQVSQMQESLKVLIAQVQMLRSEGQRSGAVAKK